MKVIFSNWKFSFAHQSKFCIIGGGTGGVNIAAHLLRSKINPRDISIFEPAPYHYYQPGWTMVGSGMTDVQTTRQPMEKVIPQNIHIVKQAVQKIDPKNKIIITNKNHNFAYEYLIISAGYELNWQKIKNAKQFLQNPRSKVCSIYDYTYSQKTNSLAKRFDGGKALFTQPPEPIKCAGAPQKILFLLNKKWKKQQFVYLDVDFVKASAQMFSVPKYSEALKKLADNNKIKVTFKHDLIEIQENKAIFQHVETKQRLQKQYDFLHMVPPMSPPKFISQSGLGNQKGYVDLNKQTLQHVKYPNVWALGDCSSLPTSKTAAAVFSQSQTLLKNLLAYYKDPTIKQLPSKYNGYTSCPIFVGDKKLVLAEFLYDKKIDQSFLPHQQIPRRIFYYLTRYGFPFFYWKLMPRGLWKGRNGIRWF